MNENYLVFSVLGPHRLDLVKIVARLCTSCGCNILDSQMTLTGEESAMMVYTAGNWSAIAKLEASLPQITQKYGLTAHSRRTFPHTPEGQQLPYTIQIIGLDKPGILGDVAQFFVREGIIIQTLDMDNQNRSLMPAHIVTINLTIQIPAKIHLASLRERFFEYCEDRNLDATMDPLRP